MKCLCCQEEMEKGFLQANNMMTWVRAPHRFALYPKKGEVMLGRNVWDALTVTAYICKPCKKVVVDYEESNYEEK